ncbi:MAG: hypothetical protein Q8O67_26740 [Deltaproteobacteria bacterium]|nr:hypothetical protein [Deltaproteobacteria bacterium]
MRRVVLAFLLAGCGVDVDAFGPARLLATDPGLLESAGAIVFTFSSTEGCGVLIDASVADVAGVIALETDPSAQRIPMLRGQVDPDRGGPAGFDDVDATHTFSTVPAGVPVALLALAVDQDPGAGFTLGGLAGSVFATACRDVTFEPGRRVEVPLVLAPAGLH